LDVRRLFSRTKFSIRWEKTEYSLRKRTEKVLFFLKNLKTYNFGPGVLGRGARDKTKNKTKINLMWFLKYP
jgi:hypothetical protein